MKKSKKKYLLASCFGIAAVLLTISVFVFRHRPPKEIKILGNELGNVVDSTSKSSTSSSTTSDVEVSLDDMMQTSGTECSHSDATSEVVVHAGKGHARMDIKQSKTDPTVPQLHFIIDAKTSYQWSDNQKVGLKVEQTGTGTNSTGFDTSKRLAYSCKGWVVDEEMFKVPAEVDFPTMADFKAVSKEPQK
jgi:hypothetical protein